MGQTADYPLQKKRLEKLKAKQEKTAKRKHKEDTIFLKKRSIMRHVIKHATVLCFKPLSFGVICYTAIGN